MSQADAVRGRTLERALAPSVPERNDFDLLTTGAAVLRREFWSALVQEGVLVEVRPGDDLDPLAGDERLHCDEPRDQRAV